MPSCNSCADSAAGHDAVSVSDTELPPPPKPSSFKTPSLSDLQTEDKKGGGLFNKLFGKE